MPREKPKESRAEILKLHGHYYLWIDDDFWMYDIPREGMEQAAIASRAHGDVIVAGYGLGVVQRYLCDGMADGRVKSVLTVEFVEDVIEECRRVFATIYGDVVIDDFLSFKTKRRFDCVVGDIWPDIYARYLGEYVKFRTKARKLLKPGGLILALGGDYFEHLLRYGKC